MFPRSCQCFMKCSCYVEPKSVIMQCPLSSHCLSLFGVDAIKSSAVILKRAVPLVLLVRGMLVILCGFFSGTASTYSPSRRYIYPYTTDYYYNPYPYSYFR